MSLMSRLSTFFYILQLVAYASNTTTDVPATTTQTTQFQTSSDILSTLQTSIDEFRDELQSAMCENGLAVGGHKCDSDFYGLQEFIDSFEEHMNVGSINASNEFSDIVATIDDKLSIRTSMLNNLSQSILSACALYAEDIDTIELPDYDSLYFGGSYDREARLPSDIAYSDIYKNDVSFSGSVFRKPNNVDYNSYAFKFDALMTSLLDPIFIELHSEYCAANHVLGRSEQFCQMYFGSVNGMFRMYPGSENPKDGNGTYKSYDPRLRPWYVSAAAGDTDVVILLDLSVSMRGKMDLVIEGLMSVFGTLSPGSFVNIIGFNDQLQETCLNDRLFRATQENFEYLQNWLENDIDFLIGYMDFVVAFDAAYELIAKHKTVYGDNCNTAILFLTDSGEEQISAEVLAFIEEKTSIRDLGVSDVRIFTYTVGNGADVDLAKSIANVTGGLYTPISENEKYIASKMSLFYKYYSFERDANDAMSISKPYFSFSTGEIQVTLSMPLFVNQTTFVGVFGMDLPLGILEDAIGNVPIGIKSYSFLMNDNGILLLHPSVPKSIDYNNGLFTEFQAILASEIEPIQFVHNGVFNAMLNRKRGFREMIISHQKSAGNTVYNGFIDVPTAVIYFYAPIGSSSLSFASVVWSDDQYEAPLISSFGLETVKPQICPDHQNIQTISELKASEMDQCIARFNLFHELNLLLQCNTSTEWVEEADILSIDLNQIHKINTWRNKFSQYEFYDKKNVSLEYSSYFLSSGLWEDKTLALKGVHPSCEELNNMQKMCIPVELSPPSNSIPYGGFKYQFSSHSLVSIYVFSSLYNWWKPAFLKADSKIVSMWFGSYQGIHFSYPGKSFSPTYINIERPWYKEATAFPDYFVLPAPYVHATTGKLVTGASTVIYAPNSTEIIGVAGMNWEYSGFVEAWRSVMSNICHGLFSFNQCYLITTSGYFLYYEDMEFDIGDADISHKFLGTIEPTLMQSLIELGLFQKRTYKNPIDKTISLTYMMDETVFVEQEFSTTFRSFEKNSGLYTIHHIQDTNLYIVFVYDYLQIAYPVNCPDNEYCKNVDQPGCIQDDTNENGIIDLEDECDIFDEKSVCALLDSNSTGSWFAAMTNKTKACPQKSKTVNVCLLEQSKTFDMCSTNLDHVIDSLVCEIVVFSFTAGEIFGIVIASMVVCGWCVGGLFLCCYCEVDNWTKNWNPFYGCNCKRDVDDWTKDWCSFVNKKNIDMVKCCKAKNKNNAGAQNTAQIQMERNP